MSGLLYNPIFQKLGGLCFPDIPRSYSVTSTLISIRDVDIVLLIREENITRCRTELLRSDVFCSSFIGIVSFPFF